MKVCKNDGKKFEDNYKFCPLCGGQLVAQNKEDYLVETIEKLKQRIEILENGKPIKRESKYIRHTKNNMDNRTDNVTKIVDYIKEKNVTLSFKEAFEKAIGRTPSGADYNIRNVLKHKRAIKIIGGKKKYDRFFIMPSILFKERKKRNYNWTPEWKERRKSMLDEIHRLKRQLKTEHPDWTYNQTCVEAGRIYKARKELIKLNQQPQNITTSL